MLLAIGKIVGLHNIRAASRMNKEVVVFISEVHMVSSVVEQGLAVHPDLFLLFSPLDTPAVKVNVSNALPFIRNDDLCAQVSKFGTIVSKITMLPIHSGRGEFKHVMTFKRVLYMILPENEQKLNVVLHAKINGHVHRMYTAVHIERFRCEVRQSFPARC